MKRSAITAALAFAVAASLGAQQPAQSGSTTRQPGTRADEQTGSARTVTVTGCLQSNDQASGGSTAPAATGSTGSTGSASAGRNAQGTYTLTNARMNSGASGASSSGTSGMSSGTSSGSSSGSSAGSTSGTSGTAGTTAAGASGGSSSGMTFTLEGKDLAQHVGHQVQVTGTMIGAGASGGSTSTGSSGTTAAGSTSSERSGGMSGGAHDNTRLRVTSVKMISASCSNQ